jgi:enamine deaminase RidA (YjgF/YER057c/UK114 family)
LPCELFIGPERHAVLELGNMARLAVMAVPGLRGSFRRQAEELMAQLMCIVRRHQMTLSATTMMVFLRNGADEAECRNVLRSWFGEAMPVTTFVVQPPCSRAALGIELWALGGPGVKVERLGPEVVAIESDGIRWVHCGGIRSNLGLESPYAESVTAFQRMQRRLATAGVGFDQVVRTWIYVNRITAGAEGRRRYQELNRARTDFYRDIRFGAKSRAAQAPAALYPASTGIGTSGANITMACMAMDSQRPDVFILPLENPQQTPACAYQAQYSPQSPKFARAMAVVQGHFISTLVSGTASIVGSKTVYPGDVARQTEQTIDNIERLIAPENFTRHGLPDAGATLKDIAKLRVYVKHQEDYQKCREVCERRLPRVPAIYLHADVCRPDLLVEIEAVAFSPFIL